MTEKPTQKTSRAIILHPNNEKILLGKRNANDRAFPNAWCLPGGKVDEGEDVMMGIIREVFEETGIKIINIEFFSQDIEMGENMIWENYYYIARLNEEVEMNIIDEDAESFQELEWMSEDQVLKIELAFGHKDVVLRFFNKTKQLKPDLH